MPESHPDEIRKLQDDEDRAKGTCAECGALYVTADLARMCCTWQATQGSVTPKR